MMEKLSGFYETVKSTRNWPSVLSVYIGLKGQTTPVFRCGSTMLLSRKSLPEYRIIRRLVGSGIKAMNTSEGLWRMELPNGLVLFARPNLTDGFTIYECFVKRLYDTKENLVDKTVVDVGAGIGDSSIFFANQGARVYSFEPNEDSFRLAIRNIKANGMERLISISQSAISDSEEEVELFSNRIHPGQTTTNPVDGLTEIYEDHTRVRSRRLTSFLIENHVTQIDLLKIDCEGCEFSLISKSNAEVLSSTREIVLEYHRDPSPLVDFLRSLGFQVRYKGTAHSDRIGQTRIESQLGLLRATRCSR